MTFLLLFVVSMDFAIDQTCITILMTQLSQHVYIEHSVMSVTFLLSVVYFQLAFQVYRVNQILS